MNDYRDICKGRHGGNANSRAANARLAPNKAKQRERVLAAIVAAGEKGITCKELAEKWGVGMNTISGRFSKLKFDKEIFPSGKRNGCGVFVAGHFPAQRMNEAEERKQDGTITRRISEARNRNAYAKTESPF